MDKLIRRFDAVQDADLMLCQHRGVAYQRDMTVGRVSYGSAYFEKVLAYEGTRIAKAVNEGRCEMLARHLPIKSTVLDIGAGTGAFIRAANERSFHAKGFDVIKEAESALKSADLYAEDPHQFDAVTMWDSIEHMEHPHLRLEQVHKGGYLFASIPVFNDLAMIRSSKHYRPGEHLYYWTLEGFIDWMRLYGFRALEASEHEVVAGREGIAAVAFIKNFPDYHDHVAAYKEMHATRHYGDSATEGYLDLVVHVVKHLKPASILDFGCGRSDLVAHFWRDGERIIGRYDPAIGKYKVMPDGRFDIAFCLDVMEHIPMIAVDKILRELHAKSFTALFAISTVPSRAKLPDGRNAHVTLLSKAEWTRWVSEYFGPIKFLKGKHEKELIILAGAGARPETWMPPLPESVTQPPP